MVQAMVIYNPKYFLFCSLWNLQDPAEADKLLKIQRELDETKIILVSFNLQLHYFMYIDPVYVNRLSFSFLLYQFIYL